MSIVTALRWPDEAPPSDVEEPNAHGPRSRASQVTRESRERREILEGLLDRPRRLPCRLFYDARGSELFERICELDEYYPTRTELGILRQNLGEIAEALGSGLTLVEYGSGASVKTRLLLHGLRSPLAYVPIEISHAALMASARALAFDFPNLRIFPICADYTTELELPALVRLGRVAAFFPGSTIGNFDPPDAVRFLARVRNLCGVGGALLIGVDLKKDVSVLEAAYNDRLGVTAEFNLNVLSVLNRDFGAHFDPNAFEHRAIWNSVAGRIEMHLVSKFAQTVSMGEQRVRLEAGEFMVTEHSYKYDLDQFAQMASASGFAVERTFTDPNHYFSVQLLRAR